MQQWHKVHADEFFFKYWRSFILLSIVPICFAFIYLVFLKYTEKPVYEAELNFYVSNHRFIEDEDIYDNALTDINIHNHELEIMAALSGTDAFFQFMLDSLELKQVLGLSADASRLATQVAFDKAFRYNVSEYHYIALMLQSTQREGMVDFLKVVAEKMNRFGMGEMNKTKDERIGSTLKKLQQAYQKRERLFVEFNDLALKIDSKGRVAKLSNTEWKSLENVLILKKGGRNQLSSLHSNEELLKVGVEVNNGNVEQYKALMVLHSQLVFLDNLIDRYKDLHLRLLTAKVYQESAIPFYKYTNVVELQPYAWSKIIARSMGIGLLFAFANLFVFYFLFKYKQIKSLQESH